MNPPKFPTLEMVFTCQWFCLMFGTPDFSIEVKNMRPRLIPRISLIDAEDNSEFRWFYTLTWFFHLTLAYGKPCQI